MVESVITSVASSVISSTINSLATLVWNEISFLREVPNEVRSIEANLNLIQGYLKDTENISHKTHLTASWLREIKHVAYQAQDVIEKFNWMQRSRRRERGCSAAFSRYYSIPGYLKSLRDIGAEIVRINKFIPGIIDMTNNLSSVNIPESSGTTDQTSGPSLEDPIMERPVIEEDEVVGFDNKISEIVTQLLDPENKELTVVSIVGMPGIGKSTLANQVSTHFEVKRHFNVIVWITVSQQYNALSLHKEILKSATQIEDKRLENMSDTEVREQLFNFLKEQKYLIVIDDIWTTESWDDINPRNLIFPNMNNGNRIILTTRNLEVGKYPEIRTFVLELELLDPEKSLELLQKKAFPPYVMVSKQERNQLECFGPQLVEKCGRLPLALIVLGGYLSKNLNYETWSRMAVTVDWVEAGEKINISQIMAHSYHYLPNYLKPLFLYITAIPEDQIIDCSDLIKLWIAEGFVPPDQKYKMEQRGRIYLRELYERGLVQVVQKNRACGRIRLIKIHDVLRDWGTKRASEEEFFSVVKRSDDVITSDIQNSYRVTLHEYLDEDVAILMSNNLRSFLGFGLPSNNISLRGLNALRVIRFHQKELGPQKLPKYIKKMVFLRYLFVERCGKIKFPSSIGQLGSLQTLTCRNSDIWSLPSSLWEISTLRHVHLGSIYCSWSGPKKGQGKNLQTLEISDMNFALAHSRSRYIGMNAVIIALEEMKEIVNLQLQFVGGSIAENILSKISGLQNLETLVIHGDGLTGIPSGSVFPPNLLELYIGCACLEEDLMPILEKLPKLVELELIRGYRLKHMHCSASGFPQLKYLTLKGFKVLEDWKVDVGAMLNLCHLELSDCNNLKIFPEVLMEHHQLKLVEVVHASHLSKLDYNRLKEKGCKVILKEDPRNS